MLIELDRSKPPGLLLQGIKNGIHWRAVRDVRTFSIEGPHMVFETYLQFFVDASANGFTRRSRLNGIPAPYNTTALGGAGVFASLTAEYYDGLPLNCKMQWIETHYGRLRMSTRLGKYVGAEMFVAWYPRKRKSRYVDVLPQTFNKYILPSVWYMCNYLTLVADGTAISLSRD